ncbi:MAG: Ig-like domain-containing protein [Clostridia bacterium]|nr:Ig-like domain-containing protein [Clostridia bacterium]
MTKRITGLLLALVMLVGLLPTATFTATAEEYPSLTFQEEVLVDVEVGEIYRYQFTPTVTQSYCFYSFDNVDIDPYVSLYTASEELILSDDDGGDGRNFRLVAKLTAGETYYLDVYDLGRDDAGSVRFTIDEIVPTDISLSPYSITRFAGTTYTLEPYVYPDGAAKTLTWSSSDEAVAIVDENGAVTALAEGTAVITVETVNGLTATCNFTVMPVDGTIALGETSMIITADDATKEATLAFTPSETGYYRFLSHDIVSENEDEEIDPRVRVYDDTCNQLIYSDDVNGVDFCAELPMTAGTTYYCEFSLYRPAATGSYQITLEKMLAATAVRIEGGDLVLDQGDGEPVSVTYTPDGCWVEGFTLSSSDESVVIADGDTLYAVGGGEAIVTATSDLGLTDSIRVTVLAATPLTLDATYTVEGTPENGGGRKRYCFTPTASGRYTIASTNTTGDEATACVGLYELGKEVRHNQTYTNAFSLTYELEAGVTYYYDVEVTCSAESQTQFVLTEADDSTIPEAPLDTDLEVAITNPGDGVYYAFTPQVTGMYTIASQMESTSDLDPKLLVYDDTWDYVTRHDDIGDGDRNFRLEYEFEAGKTYYLKAILYQTTDTGTYTMRIEPDFDADQTATIDGTISGVEEDTEVTILLTEDGFSEPSYEVVVSGNSAYEITDVPLATYTITVTADGYVTFEDVCILQDDVTINVEMVKGKPSYSVWVYLDEADEYPVFGVSVEEGDTVVEPAEPGREGMAFLGWYADGVKYDFSAPVMGDLHLVAKFGLLGDMNLDGALNTMDALLLFGCVNGARVMTAEQEAVADYTEDGNINMMDALRLFKTVSGQ